MFRKFYAPRNILSLALHYGALGGVIVATSALAQPWVLLATTMLAGTFSAVNRKKYKDFLENELVEHTPDHKDSPRLMDMVRFLYHKSGLSTSKYPIYNFRLKESPDQKEEKPNPEEGASEAEENLSLKDTLREIFNKMAKVPNAAAINIDRPVIMISDTLLKLLNDDEEFAVLAHEFTHAAAQHHRISFPHKLLSASAQLSNFLAVLATALSSGLVAITADVCASISIQRLFRRNLSIADQALLEKQEDNLTLPEIFRKNQLTKAQQRLLKPVSVGIFTCANPAYLGIYAAAMGINTASTALTQSFSRSMEYQADRGAVTLGANPLNLITALRKITLLMDRSKQNAWGDAEIPKPGALTRLWNRVSATHPPLENRIQRLVEIARENDLPEDSIQQAVNGTLDISDVPDVPYETIRMLAMRFYPDDGSGTAFLPGPEPQPAHTLS